MDEQAWLTTSDAQAMMSFLHTSGMLSDRKARLFAGAAVRRVWRLLADERSRKAVEVAEQFADGLASEKELETALTHAHHVFASVEGELEESLAWASAWTADSPTLLVARSVADWTAQAQLNAEQAMRENTQLIHDIFGPLPFHSLRPLPPPVRAWNDGFIQRLAEVAYQHRLLPSGHLDSERLGVLADAMEKSGVCDVELVEHLRGPGLHFRGCFVVDLLTGRE